jgi:hypothetical protein
VKQKLLDSVDDLQNFTAPILTIIFQKSLQTGCIPTDWKHANVAPAYKKGEKYNTANYRPISLIEYFYLNLQQVLEQRTVVGFHRI